MKTENFIQMKEVIMMDILVLQKHSQKNRFLYARNLDETKVIFSINYKLLIIFNI